MQMPTWARASMRRAVELILLLVATSAVAAPVGDGTIRAPRTALVVAAFDGDGHVRITDVAHRAGAFRAKAAPLARIDGAKPALGPTARASEVALVVLPPDSPDAVVLDLPLGPAGDTDPWAVGSTVVRAPWFGPGTSYQVVRTAPAPIVAFEPYRAP